MKQRYLCRVLSSENAETFQGCWAFGHVKQIQAQTGKEDVEGKKETISI